MSGIPNKYLKRLYAVLFAALVYAATLFLHTYTNTNPPPAPIYANDSVSLIVQPQDGMSQLVSLIDGAQESVDLVIYEITDQNILSALKHAHDRGVDVRVIINKYTWDDKEMKVNMNAFEYLTANGVPVKAATDRYQLTHQKTLVIDNTTAVIMTFNLVTKYYKTGRDFGIVNTHPDDVSEIVRVFDADWNDAPVTPKETDLVWSPGSRDELISVIDSATKYLLVYCQEMGDRASERALKQAAERGVKVMVLMTDAPNWHKAYASLVSSGVEVRTFDAKDKTIYIHTKVIIADGERAYVGSENFSAASLDKNRELGIILSKKDVIEKISGIFAADWSRAQPITGQ